MTAPKPAPPPTGPTGQPGQRPIRGNNAVPLNEARNEMRRLMGELMKVNRKFLQREREVERLHAAGVQNYSGELLSVMNNDLLLAMHSGASKTISILIQGIAAYIQAELAMKQEQRRAHESTGRP